METKWRPLKQMYGRGAWLWRYAAFEGTLLPLRDLRGRLIPQQTRN
jgi:hypothetical protein